MRPRLPESRGPARSTEQVEELESESFLLQRERALTEQSKAKKGLCLRAHLSSLYTPSRCSAEANLRMAVLTVDPVGVVLRRPLEGAFGSGGSFLLGRPSAPPAVRF